MLKRFVLLFVFSMVFCSCLERDELFVQFSDSITFNTQLQQHNQPKTKVCSSNLTSFTQDWDLYDTKAITSSVLSGDVRIIGFHYPDSFYESLESWPTLSNSIFTFKGDELTSSSPVRWAQIPASSKRLKLFAYTPIDNIEGAELPGATVTGTPQITYTLPQDITKQIDLITAVKEVDSKLKQSIPIIFNHIFTALKFKMGFDCIVKSITISGVYNKAVYKIGTGWSSHSIYTDDSNNGSYTISFGDTGKSVKANDDLLAASEVMMMIPQTVPYESGYNPFISVVYSDSQGSGTITASLKGQKWEEDRLITYTLHKKLNDQGYIYFDLTAGNVEINNSTYTGSVYVGGEVQTITGSHSPNNKYYVYQSSTSTNPSFADFTAINTGYATLADFNNKVGCRIPAYDFVTYNGKLWSDFITNNTEYSVEDIIEIWDNGNNIRSDGSNAPDERFLTTAVVREVGRTHTTNFIKVTGTDAIYDLTIDNIYSVIQQPVLSTGGAFRVRSVGGISYIPEGSTELNITFLGDNRMGCLHIHNTPTDKITLQGTGSLTVCDADFRTVGEVGAYSNDVGSTTGYISNFWNSAIGNNTDDKSTTKPYNENVYKLYFNGGVVYAGTTKAEDCTAIGGGGNGFGQVFITGGTVTAVSTTAGTAIGGGMGHTSAGGAGEVNISGGNVYAYNFANKWSIPSSAIGGGGSNSSTGSDGTVNISGGNIYAYSALGTAIGAGSSNAEQGGNAEITITGGYIVAKSGGSNGIGGGKGGANAYKNGGNATVRISGNPIIRTGSIGGGKTLSPTGKIGYADVEISGGDIQAQFVLAAGASSSPKFTMTGGVIRNSYTNDTEYKPVQNFGGAVYMEDGTFIMKDGNISNCLADLGGAIYIKGSSATSFTMEGGTIEDCISITHGGAVYMEGGTVTLSGGNIINNLAKKGNGGGVYIQGGDFLMPESGTASINDNAAFSENTQGCGRGGGIYITSNSGNLDVNVLSGNIKKNTSDRMGGGIAVDLPNSQVSSTVTVGVLGDNSTPLISENKTVLSGGGLYVNGENANIIMNGGTILGNITSAYVDNEDVANEDGMVTLNGGEVTHVVVTYMPNAANVAVTDNNGNSVTSLSQKIVTATNNKMVIPGTFSRTNWEIYAWHTRSDGDDTKGTRYAPGANLNLSSNVTLYALWREK